VTKSFHSESDSDDEEDPYNNPANSLVSSLHPDGYKYRTDTKEYLLPEWFSLPASLYERLFEHQKAGVRWLYNLYRNKKGGVLGDDMGLGKTV
jgi:SNF2 family DNA or RNA helicase